jgi:hypothetical protein
VGSGGACAAASHRAQIPNCPPAQGFGKYITPNPPPPSAPSQYSARAASRTRPAGHAPEAERVLVQVERRDVAGTDMQRAVGGVVNLDHAALC